MLFGMTSNLPRKWQRGEPVSFNFVESSDKARWTLLKKSELLRKQNRKQDKPSGEFCNRKLRKQRLNPETGEYRPRSFGKMTRIQVDTSQITLALYWVWNGRKKRSNAIWNTGSCDLANIREKIVRISTRFFGISWNNPETSQSRISAEAGQRTGELFGVQRQAKNLKTTNATSNGNWKVVNLRNHFRKI